MKEIPAMTNAQDVSAPSRLDDVQASIVADLLEQGVTLATTGREEEVRRLLDSLPRQTIVGDPTLRRLAILLSAVEGNLAVTSMHSARYAHGRVDEASVILDCLPALNSPDRPLPGSGVPSLGAAWPMTRLVWTLRLLLNGDMRGARLAFQELAWVSADMPIVELLRLNGVAYCLLREGRSDEAGIVFAHVENHMVAHGLQGHPITFIVDAATALWWAVEGNQERVSFHRASALNKMEQIGPVLGLLKIAILTTLAQADLTIGHLEGCEELLRRVGSPDRKALTPHLRRRTAALWTGLEAARGQSTEDHQVTRAQARVLALLETPMTVPDIAKSMGLSPATVRTHVRALYARYGVRRRSELIQQARRGPQVSNRAVP